MVAGRSPLRPPPRAKPPATIVLAVVTQPLHVTAHIDATRHADATRVTGTAVAAEPAAQQIEFRIAFVRDFLTTGAVLVACELCPLSSNSGSAALTIPALPPSRYRPPA